tara:strand:- start:218 stop:421 length:204 start_codon:yes stop_codon:yes gene_type:complete
MSEKDLSDERLAFYDKLVTVLTDLGDFDEDDAEAIDDMHGIAGLLMEGLDIQPIEVKDGKILFSAVV